MVKGKRQQSIIN